MGNYIVNACFYNSEYVVTADTALTVGNIISFYYGESLICGVVGEETDEPYTSIYNAPQTDCCDCYREIGIRSFEFDYCPPYSGSVLVDQAWFCQSYSGDTPVVGQVFVIQDPETDLNRCATASELSYDRGQVVELGDGPYTSCEICDEPPEPPRSANTEVFICEICCDCGATGSTINQVTPPNPVWTDGYGTAVTQLNMIVLGGINGLNN